MIRGLEFRFPYFPICMQSVPNVTSGNNIFESNHKTNAGPIEIRLWLTVTMRYSDKWLKNKADVLPVIPQDLISTIG